MGTLKRKTMMLTMMLTEIDYIPPGYKSIIIINSIIVSLTTSAEKFFQDSLKYIMKKKRLDKEVYYTCLCLNLLEKWMISPFFF